VNKSVQFANIEYGGKALELEYSWILPDNPGPLIVFLHEGLGSVTMWRTFPRSLCAVTGYRGLVYSRCGYGSSTPFWPARIWPVEFMHVEAREMLPRFLASVGVNATQGPPVLLGHSDGASIALIYACALPGQVAALITLAPHVFVEDITLDSIARTRQNYIDTNLPQRLKRYHHDADHVFWGWAGVWLNPEFRRWNIESLLVNLACPTLTMQGYEDQYGTMRQIESIRVTVSQVELIKLANCGHSPHIDQAEGLIAAIDIFLHSNPAGAA
jgi:pimeloyl-ACP methyl ester carboxylesterase